MPKTRIDWDKCKAVVNQEWPRITAAFEQFLDKHPEWESSLHRGDYPPEAVLMFFLKVHQDSRRATVPNPTRISRLKPEELDVVASFVASIAGELIPKFRESKNGLLFYDLRPKYNDYQLGD